jgi:hypothetical protein
VNKKDWAEFAAVREKWMPMMEQPPQVQAQTQDSTSAPAR